MKIVLAPSELLRVKTKPVKKVTPELLSTVKEMIRLTESFTDPEGVGLAATQVGLSGQFFVIKHDEGDGKTHYKAYFNPRILKYSKKSKLYLEGCLSLPNYWGNVDRSFWVDVSYIDNQGQKNEERLKGFPAWVFQHEFDHLQGKLFVDHVLEQKQRFFKVVGKDRAGAEIFEEIKL